jgi:trk system potassium uptake protein TrkA
MDAELLEFVVNEDSKVCNKTIKDLKFPRCAIIAGVIRDGKGYIVLGDFKILSDDRIVVCCLNDSINKIEKLF